MLTTNPSISCCDEHGKNRVRFQFYIAMRADELEVVIRNDIPLSMVTGAKLFYRDSNASMAVPRFVRVIDIGVLPK